MPRGELRARGSGASFGHRISRYLGAHYISRQVGSCTRNSVSPQWERCVRGAQWEVRRGNEQFPVQNNPKIVGLEPKSIYLGSKDSIILSHKIETLIF